MSEIHQLKQEKWNCLMLLSLKLYFDWMLFKGPPHESVCCSNSTACFYVKRKSLHVFQVYFRESVSVLTCAEEKLQTFTGCSSLCLTWTVWGNVCSGESQCKNSPSSLCNRPLSSFNPKGDCGILNLEMQTEHESKVKRQWEAWRRNEGRRRLVCGFETRPGFRVTGGSYAEPSQPLGA